ncbi:MAG: GFA family protein [Lysobacteraceae bacterium]
MSYTGSCTCGAVSYEASGTPVIQGNCHCRHCQKSSGSAYTASMFFPHDAVKVHGELKSFRGAGESGTTEVLFCPICGTKLLSRPATMNGLTGIRAGTLDDPNLFQPAGDIFTRSAAVWDHMDPALPKFETYPPMG